MNTDGVSIEVAGAITIALLVVLGIFVYPWLLSRPRGVWWVALATILLSALFIALQGTRSSLHSLAFAASGALGPLIAAVIVRRIDSKDT